MLRALLSLVLFIGVQSITDHEDRQIILTAHGMSMDDVENRVVIPSKYSSDFFCFTVRDVHTPAHSP